MTITERFFQIETEWNVIHLPFKPNGFGILIIGDRSDFVDETSSFWHQHYGRNQLISDLMKQGYTLFHSNLYGNHWGSPRSVTMAKQLYHLVMKKEILNQRIHLLIDGMGGLTGLQLMQEIPERIRSVAMMNPCLDLQAHLENEKEHKFFYKRLIKEISAAYGVDPKIVSSLNLPTLNTTSTIPVRIWHKTNSTIYSPQDHSKKYEEMRNKAEHPIQLIYHLGDNLYRINQSIIRFFKENEKVL
ncbi:alpha/beta hydrolase [Metabacillus niabensis]|uniref:alpha/beta hydrolase n=1 Tax=Metabacillus niabensis TaxID=324854 RepID=UPI001CF98286|nr:alpha/beta hydrolase [Metabacillus niabensis]